MLTKYPQTLSDIKVGLRLQCKDRASLRQIGYTKPIYAIVLMIFRINGETICAIRFTDCTTGNFVTEHCYHAFVQNGSVYFQQIQKLYDSMVICKPHIIKLISS